MAKSDLIKKLEKDRNSRVISYVTNDMPPFVTQIAGDVVPPLSDLLDGIGKVKKISLFLYTAGGDMLAPIRIVKLIRNHCDEFEVLVPYKAHSAGTLITLGADKIVMSKLGELSPVDPTTGHPFNPPNPMMPQQLLPISVEDLNSFLLFAKEKGDVDKTQMVEVYKLLVEKLHPLSIGNAYRAYRMARLLTERLLCLHMDKKTQAEQINSIVKAFTGDITIHAYPIDRDEATDLGLNIEKAQGDLDKTLRELYEDYARDMHLGKQFNPVEVLATKDTVDVQRAGAYLETSDNSYEFMFTGRLQKTIRNNQPVVDVNLQYHPWVKKK